MCGVGGGVKCPHSPVCHPGLLGLPWEGEVVDHGHLPVPTRRCTTQGHTGHNKESRGSGVGWETKHSSYMLHGIPPHG